MGDHTLLANPPVVAIFCLFRWLHFIASEPYWLYVGVVVGGGLASVLSTVFWGDQRRRWHLNAHVAANMAVIAVVAYSTGWGPILSIGFLFGAAASIAALRVEGDVALPGVDRRRHDARPVAPLPSMLAPTLDPRAARARGGRTRSGRASCW